MTAKGHFGFLEREEEEYILSDFVDQLKCNSEWRPDEQYVSQTADRVIRYHKVSLFPSVSAGLILLSGRILGSERSAEHQYSLYSFATGEATAICRL